MVERPPAWRIANAASSILHLAKSACHGFNTAVEAERPLRVPAALGLSDRLDWTLCGQPRRVGCSLAARGCSLATHGGSGAGGGAGGGGDPSSTSGPYDPRAPE